MNPSLLVRVWQKAADDLGIEIVILFVLRLRNGEEVRADLLVKHFGPMLVATEALEEVFRRLGHQIAAEGYGATAYFGEEFEYDRERFVETLKNWGWTGSEAQRPDWYA